MRAATRYVKHNWSVPTRTPTMQCSQELPALGVSKVFQRFQCVFKSFQSVPKSSQIVSKNSKVFLRVPKVFLVSKEFLNTLTIHKKYGDLRKDFK